MAKTLTPHQDPDLIRSDLAPTAEVPTTRTPERPACYVPCPTCGRKMLVGDTATRGTLALDVNQQTYCVLWDAGAAKPRLVESAGYPVHQCKQGAQIPTPPAEGKSRGGVGSCVHTAEARLSHQS